MDQLVQLLSSLVINVITLDHENFRNFNFFRSYPMSRILLSRVGSYNRCIPSLAVRISSKSQQNCEVFDSLLEDLRWGEFLESMTDSPLSPPPRLLSSPFTLH